MVKITFCIFYQIYHRDICLEQRLELVFFSIVEFPQFLNLVVFFMTRHVPHFAKHFATNITKMPLLNSFRQLVFLPQSKKVHFPFKGAGTGLLPSFRRTWWGHLDLSDIFGHSEKSCVDWTNHCLSDDRFKLNKIASDTTECCLQTKQHISVFCEHWCYSIADILVPS